ncbi:hypothetical protein [Curtobacterium sp. DN_7.5]|uniref:hypothetical protein n=1 Tax=Curtobacterium sp. DN_7.5 TaxID=3049047 RepID=UPI001F5614BA|nr:hypothetical protein [Curtobacterium sp. DN_7.5]
MNAPDPTNVVAHQLRLAQASIKRARQDSAVSTDVQSALLSLHAAVEALAKLQGIDPENPPAGGGYAVPRGVPREPGDLNPGTMDF